MVACLFVSCFLLFQNAAVNMQDTFQHLYRFSPSHGGVLYAWFSSMHTRVDVALCGEQGEAALMAAVGTIRETLCHLEKLANYYDAESELARLNRMAAIVPHPVSPELYDMLAFCMDSHARTGGCFDVTVHSAHHTPQSIHGIQLSPREHTLFFLQPGTTINLSGFLKGYALEKIRGVLQHYEVENALVNLGNSSILALGHPPLADGWKVGFRQGNARQDRAQQTVLLQNECLTTSGNGSSERKHIIDPRTGLWVEGRREVAVVTENGAIGEVLSTSLFVADDCQRELLKAEFHPRLILDI